MIGLSSCDFVDQSLPATGVKKHLTRGLSGVPSYSYITLILFHLILDSILRSCCWLRLLYWHLHRHSNEGHRTTAGGNACLHARQRTVEDRCSSSWNELDIVVVVVVYSIR